MLIALLLVVFLSKEMERFYEKIIFCFILSLAVIRIDALIFLDLYYVGQSRKRKVNQTVCFLIFGVNLHTELANFAGL